MNIRIDSTPDLDILSRPETRLVGDGLGNEYKLTCRDLTANVLETQWRWKLEICDFDMGEFAFDLVSDLFWL